MYAVGVWSAEAPVTPLWECVWYDHPCFSYSQQITSDLYVGVNPGMTRGRSSRRCICNLSVGEDLAVQQLQTQ